MKIETRPLGDKLVTLEPADTTNVELLVRWTLDPIAQGPHKRIPEWSVAADERRAQLSSRANGMCATRG
jgi:hypothetical protein